MSSNPICLVYIKIDDISKYAPMQSKLEQQFKGYHVLVVPASATQQVYLDVKVVNAKNFNKVTFNQLKEEITKAIETLSTELKHANATPAAATDRPY